MLVQFKDHHCKKEERGKGLGEIRILMNIKIDKEEKIFTDFLEINVILVRPIVYF